MKKVLLGNEEYNYKINEKGEEVLTKNEKVGDKEIQVVLKGNSSRRFKID